MIKVTSKTGKTVEMAIEGATVIAKVAGMSFAIEREGGKIESRWLVPEAGNRRVEIALAGPDLDQANALFDELDALVARNAAAGAIYDANVDRVLRKMEGN